MPKYPKHQLLHKQQPLKILLSDNLVTTEVPMYQIIHKMFISQVPTSLTQISHTCDLSQTSPITQLVMRKVNQQASLAAE